MRRELSAKAMWLGPVAVPSGLRDRRHDVGVAEIVAFEQ
jgi:hypothetical protein